MDIGVAVVRSAAPEHQRRFRVGGVKQRRCAVMRWYVFKVVALYRGVKRIVGVFGVGVGVIDDKVKFGEDVGKSCGEFSTCDADSGDIAWFKDGKS